MNLDGPSTGSGAGQSQLRVATRGDGETTISSRLYVFNDASRCIQLLTPDVHEQFVTTNLPAGTYDLCGIGSDDLCSVRIRHSLEHLNDLVCRVSGLTL